MPMRSAIVKGFKFGSGAALFAVSAVAYKNRPVYHAEPHLKDLEKSPQQVVEHVRADDYLRTGLYSPRTEDESILLKAARVLSINLVVGISRVFMEILNDTKIAGNEANYAEMMRLVHEGRRRNRGMITVSNHTSVFDDPVLQSSITKFLWNPDHMRWGICKESICFKSSLASAFVGAGKVFPIRVGAGIEQKAMKAMGRRLAEGDWVHIYPEGACIQSGHLGRGQYVGCRDEEKAKEIGLLKWGVGKLAARTAFQENQLPPLIIPYYHIGMEKIKPQLNEPTTNGLIDPWYIPGRIGKSVRVFVGQPIDISDLIMEYEKQVGRKRRIAYVDSTNELKDWDGSTKDELELYSKITKRVEEALLKLEEEATNYK